MCIFHIYIFQWEKNIHLFKNIYIKYRNDCLRTLPEQNVEAGAIKWKITPKKTNKPFFFCLQNKSWS